MIEFARKKRGSGEGNMKVKNWMPHHTAIVMGYIQGHTHTDLAIEFKLTEAAISTIINSRQGKIIRANVDAKVFSESYQSLPETRKQAIIKAQQRILDFLSDDELQERAPLLCAPINIKAFDSLVSADKVSIQAGGNVTINQQTNILGSNEKVDALLEGLRRSEIVAEMHKTVTGASVDKISQLEEVKVALVK